MPAVSDVGYIGLGNIGKPSAARLLRGPWRTHVYDVNEAASRDLARLGAISSESPAELAAHCLHIGICVRDEAQVEALLYGAEGLLNNAATGTLIAIHSTVTFAALNRWGDDAERADLQLIDAAITGGQQGAAAGTLCYMVGGSIENLNRASPVFATSAGNIVHAGALGAGMLLKLCNNLMTYAEFMAMSEACKLAEAGGLSLQALREVGLSNGVVNESMYSFVENRNAATARAPDRHIENPFSAFGKLAEKDLDCALKSAQDLEVDLPSTRRLRQVVYDLFMNKA